MLFPTHLLAAAVAGRLARLSPWLVVVGTVIPDAVDKPLGSLGVFEVYHSVGHSALLLVVAVPVALSGRRGLALAVGWALHLALDVLHVVVNGRPGDAAFLVWPLVTRTDPLAIPPGDFFWYYLGTPSFYLEVALWLGVAAWLLRGWLEQRQPE